jgi:hypothetical protein
VSTVPVRLPDPVLLHRGDTVSHAGVPPWTGQVMQVIEPGYYYIYWAGKGGSWHGIDELILEVPSG